MLRRMIGLVVLALSASLTGCSICQSPEDYTYGYYGGLYQRTDPVHGRAGSILGTGVVAEEGEFVEEGDMVEEDEIYYDQAE